MLHSLAETYGLLPSEVYAKADTFDIWVYDTAVSYRNKQQNSRLKVNSNIPKSQDYDITTLEEIFNRVTNKQK